MILGVAVQQPIEVLDWDVKYDDWIGIDSLASATITITPDTGTLSVSHQIVNDPDSQPDMVKLWIQGGEDGDEYTIEVNAISAAGRTKQDEVLVHIKDYV